MKFWARICDSDEAERNRDNSWGSSFEASDSWMSFDPLMNCPNVPGALFWIVTKLHGQAKQALHLPSTSFVEETKNYFSIFDIANCYQTAGTARTVFETYARAGKI